MVKIGSQSVVNDFAHGWESQGHVLRVAISTKGVYSFSVDGVTFEDFPTETESKKMQQDIASKTKKEDTHTKPRRLSVTKKTEHPVISKRPSATFDPFAANGSGATTTTSSSSFFDQAEDDSFGGGFDSTDPFASSSSSASVTKSTDPFSAGFNTTPSSSSKSTSSAQLFEQVKPQAVKPVPTLARQFTSPPEKQHSEPSTFNSNDLFAEHSSSTSSPPPPLPPPQQQKPQQNHVNIDFFADTTASNSPSVQMPTQTQSQPSSDFFGESSQQQQQTTSSSSNAFDFTGMTYEMPTPGPMQHNQSIPEVLSPQQQQAQQQQAQQQQACAAATATSIWY